LHRSDPEVETGFQRALRMSDIDALVTRTHIAYFSMELAIRPEGCSKKLLPRAATGHVAVQLAWSMQSCRADRLAR
jgi:hypothetical protein